MSQWGRVAQWLLDHPGPAQKNRARSRRVSRNNDKAPTGQNVSGSVSDSVLVLPSPSQGYNRSNSSESGTEGVELYASSLSGQDSDSGHRNWLSSVGVTTTCQLESPLNTASDRILYAPADVTAETGSVHTAADHPYTPRVSTSTGTGLDPAAAGQVIDAPAGTAETSDLSPRAAGHRAVRRVPSDGPSVQKPTYSTASGQTLQAPVGVTAGTGLVPDPRNPVQATASHGPRLFAGTVGVPNPWSAGLRPGSGTRGTGEPAPRAVHTVSGPVITEPVVTPIPLGSRNSGVPPRSRSAPTETVPVSRETDLGLFAGRSASRKRVGSRAMDPPPAKRAAVGPPTAVPAARDPDPVALLRQAAQLMGYSLGDGNGRPTEINVEPAPPPVPDYGPRDPPPAALGAPPGEETYPVPDPDTGYLEADTESSMSGSVFTAAGDVESDGQYPRAGETAQALLRKYLPQIYGPAQAADGQPDPTASLLFKGRVDPPSGIPLTADFQQEYARLSREAKDHTPSGLRRNYRFLTDDYEKFFVPETISPEFHRVADKKSRGNPFRTKSYKERDGKWVRVADFARTSMRLAAYGGAVASLLARADELRVTAEDRRALLETLLDLSEASWSQATRTALYSTRQRRTTALETMGFAHRDAVQIGKSIPFEGPHLFAGQAIHIFDEECAYRKRADETAARFLQSRKPRPAQGRGTGTPRRPPPSASVGRQVTVTLPGPATAPAQRASGQYRSRGSRRRGGRGRGFHQAPRQGGQGI